MDEFQNYLNNEEENSENNPNVQETEVSLETQNAEIDAPDFSPEAENSDNMADNSFEPQPQTQFEENAEFRNMYNEAAPVYNPVAYTEVKPMEDYAPMSRGLKVFAGLMAAIILLTGTCLAGYFVGKNSVKSGFVSKEKVEINLASRPKNTDEMTEAQVYEAVNKSVVGIVIYNENGNGSQATGIVYSEDGYIVTNDHIYSEIPKAKFKIYTHDGKEYDAEYVAGDVISDLAVLKVKGAKLTPAEFGNSDEIFHGEHVVAIGRPSDATSDSSITRGIISAVSRRIQTTSNYSQRLIQTDSAINPGSSGGALVNMYGQVIGVTASKLASVEYDAVGYAIPTTVMKRFAQELISEGKVVSRAKLGITYTAIDSVTAEINNQKHVGLYVASVTEDSDLYGKIGEGDVITHINGIEVVDDDVVLDLIEKASAGDKISVTVITSDGDTKNFDAVLKANIGESSYSETENLQDEEAQQLPSGDEQDGNNDTFDFPLDPFLK